jgi:hypothetical protein
MVGSNGSVAGTVVTTDDVTTVAPRDHATS